MNALMINGRKLAYERSGSGTPLVLLHGYPLDHSIWEPLIPRLEKEADLILPDLPGFGSSQPFEANYNMADLAADIAGLLDALHIQRAAIAGHSMGGYVALAFLRAYPKRLLGLGLVSSQILADAPERKAGRYKDAESILAHGVREVADGMSMKLTANPDLQGWIRGLILRQRPVGLTRALRAMAERPDSSDLFSGLNIPLCLIHGTADELIPVERARSLKAAVPAAHFTEIPAAGHMPMLETPRETAEALRALL